MPLTFSQYLQQSETDNGRLGVTLDGILNSTAEVVGTTEAGSDGYTIRKGALEEPGFRGAPRGATSPQYAQLMREARRIIDGAFSGNRWMAYRLQEAMTTSDFSLLFGDVLDRSVLANYAETPYTWDLYCKRATLNDFRLARMFRVDRGAAVLDGPILPNSYDATGSGSTGIEQVSEYPLRKRVVTGYTDQLYKFGCRMDFSFETIANDDLDALKDTPALFGRAARRTEEKRATALFCSSTGPNATFFAAGNNNIMTSAVFTSIGATGYTLGNNPALSIDAVKWALVLLARQRDLDGEPIAIESAVLVYPPELKVDAENILNAREIYANIEGGNTQTATAGGSTFMYNGIKLVTANWAAKFAQGALNYYLPVVNTTNGGTAWYIFATPKNGRPALQQSFLRGRERPQIFMRLPNQVAIGEGRMGPGPGVMPGTTNVNPLEGDYDNDGIDYKIRHFLGGTLLDPKCAVCSNGSGA